MHAIASLLPHLSDGIQNYALCALLLSFHNVEKAILNSHSDFILYIFFILLGGIRIPMLKFKIKSFLAAVGRGGNPHGPNCSSPTDVKPKIAQVRQTSVKDSSSPTAVGQIQRKETISNNS